MEEDSLPDLDVVFGRPVQELIQTVDAFLTTDGKIPRKSWNKFWPQLADEKGLATVFLVSLISKLLAVETEEDKDGRMTLRNCFSVLNLWKKTEETAGSTKKKFKKRNQITRENMDEWRKSYTKIIDNFKRKMQQRAQCLGSPTVFGAEDALGVNSGANLSFSASPSGGENTLANLEREVENMDVGNSYEEGNDEGETSLSPSKASIDGAGGVETATSLLAASLASAADSSQHTPSASEPEHFNTSQLKHALVNSIYFIGLFYGFDAAEGTFERVLHQWSAVIQRASRFDVVLNEVVCQLSAEPIDRIIQFVDRVSDIPCIQGMDHPLPQARKGAEYRHMCPSLLFPFILCRMKLRADWRMLIHTILTFLKHPGMTSLLGRVFGLLCFLRELIPRTQLSSGDRRRVVEVLQGLYGWPDPYGRLAAELLELAEAEICPGTLLREREMVRRTKYKNSRIYVFAGRDSDSSHLIPSLRIYAQRLSTLSPNLWTEFECNFLLNMLHVDSSSYSHTVSGTLYEDLRNASKEIIHAYYERAVEIMEGMEEKVARGGNPGAVEKQRAADMKALEKSFHESVKSDLKKSGQKRLKLSKDELSNVYSGISIQSMGAKAFVRNETCPMPPMELEIIEVGTKLIGNELQFDRGDFVEGCTYPKTEFFNHLREIIQRERDNQSAGGGRVDVRVGLVGDQSIVQQALWAYATLLSQEEATGFLDEIDVTFFLIPCGDHVSETAAFLAAYDGWYSRHVFDFFLSHRPFVPTLHVAHRSLESEVGGALPAKLKAMTGMKVESSDEKDVLADKGIFTPMDLGFLNFSSYVENAANVVNAVVFEAVVTRIASSSTSTSTVLEKVKIPFIERVEIGYEASSRARKLKKEKGLESISLVNSGAGNVPVYDITLTLVDPCGNVYINPFFEQKTYQKVVFANTSKHGDYGALAVPTLPWLEFHALDRVSEGKKQNRKLRVNTQHVGSFEVHRKDSQRFDLLIDGHLFLDCLSVSGSPLQRPRFAGNTSSFGRNAGATAATGGAGTATTASTALSGTPMTDGGSGGGGETGDLGGEGGVGMMRTELTEIATFPIASFVEPDV